MTYTKNIPVSGDSLGGTRVRINTNFQEIFNLIAINHVGFNTTGKGKHKFVQMPSLGNADTLPSGLILGEGTLYTNTVSSRSELYYTPDASGNVYQMTRCSTGSYASFAAANPGWTFLPGGLLLQYGAKNSPGTSGTINFPRAFSSAYYSITFGISRSASSSTQNVYVDNSVPVSTSSFAYTSTSNNSDPIYWMAIGF